LHKLTGQTLL